MKLDVTKISGCKDDKISEEQLKMNPIQRRSSILFGADIDGFAITG